MCIRDRLYTALRDHDVTSAKDLANSRFEKAFQAAMDDDFNTPEAMSALFDLARECNRVAKSGEADAEQRAAQLARLLVRLGGVLGLLQGDAETFLQSGSADAGIDADAIDALVAQRRQARADKNWALADEIRDKLTAMDVVVEDGADGSRWRIERHGSDK